MKRNKYFMHPREGVDRSQSPWQSLLLCAHNPAQFFKEFEDITLRHKIHIRSREELEQIVGTINHLLSVPGSPDQQTEEPGHVAWPVTILNAGWSPKEKCTLVADILNTGGQWRINHVSVLGGAMQARGTITPVVEDSATDIAEMLLEGDVSPGALQTRASTLGREQFLQAIAYCNQHLAEEIPGRTPATVMTATPLVLEGKQMSVCVHKVGQKIVKIEVIEGILPSQQTQVAASATTQVTSMLEGLHESPEQVREQVGEHAAAIAYEDFFPRAAAFYDPAQAQNPVHQSQIQGCLQSPLDDIKDFIGSMTDHTQFIFSPDDIEHSKAGVQNILANDSAGNPILVMYLNLKRHLPLFEPLRKMSPHSCPQTPEQYAAWFGLLEETCHYAFIDFHMRHPKDMASNDSQWYMEMIAAIDKYMIWQAREPQADDAKKRWIVDTFLTNAAHENAVAPDFVRHQMGHRIAHKIIGWIQREQAKGTHLAIEKTLAYLRKAPIKDAKTYVQGAGFSALLAS